MDGPMRERTRALRRSLLGIAAMVVFLLFAVGCGDDDEDAGATGGTESADTAAAPKGKPIVIGMAVAKSGFAEAFDWPPAQAAVLAVDDINAAGGVLDRPLKVVIEDTKSELDLGGPAAARTIQKGAQVGVVTCDLNLAGPAALEFAKNDMVSMSTCAGDPAFRDLSPFAFSAGVANPAEAAGAADWASQEGYKKAYVIHDTTLSYYVTWAAAFKRTFEHFGGEVVGEDRFKSTDPSVAPQITRLRELEDEPDLIVMCSQTSLGGPTLIRQIRAAGIDTPILMCVGMQGKSWLASVPGLENAYVTAYSDFTGDDENPKVNDIAERFVEEYGQPDNSHPIEGYGAIEILVEAIKRAGTAEGPALRAELEKFDKVDVASGATTFTPEWHISFDRHVVIQEIKDGEQTSVARVTPKKVFYPDE